jgi:hypothetical protein
VIIIDTEFIKANRTYRHKSKCDEGVWRSGSKYPLVFNLSIIRMLVLCFTLRPLCSSWKEQPIYETDSFQSWSGSGDYKKKCRFQESNPEYYWLIHPGFCADAMENDKGSVCFQIVVRMPIILLIQVTNLRIKLPWQQTKLHAFQYFVKYFSESSIIFIGRLFKAKQNYNLLRLFHSLPCKHLITIEIFKY